MAFPQAFLFDMDGLLLDTERLFVQFGVEISQRFGKSVAEAEAFLPNLVGSGSKTTRDALTQFLGSEAAMERFLVDWHAGVDDLFVATGVPVKPTVREALDALAARDARMAVVTSTKGETARRHLQEAGLLGFFEQVTGGDEVTANKPDPAPYLQAAAGLGVDPKRCVAFEDSDRGTTAAVRAGCLTVQIPDIRPAGQPFPDLGQRQAATLWKALEDLQIFPSATGI